MTEALLPNACEDTDHEPVYDDHETARIDEVAEILEKGDVVVYKPNRSDFTSSAISEAYSQGKKVLVVVPVRKNRDRITSETIPSFDGVICKIPGNSACLKMKQTIRDDGFLAELPIPIEKCRDCEEYNHCPVTKIHRIDHFDVAVMTYSKLEVVALSGSNAEKLGKKFEDVDLVIFEQAHVISYPSLPSVEINRIVKLPQGGFRKLLSVYNRFRKLIDNDHREHMRSIEMDIEEYPNTFTGFKIDIPPISKIGFSWIQLFEIAKERNTHWDKKIANNEVRALRDIVSIMSGKTATISRLDKDNQKQWVITGDTGRIQFAIRRLLEDIAPNAKACFVSGTLIERRPGFLSALAHRELTHCVLHDRNETNSNLHIHPSKWRFSDWKGDDGIDRAIKEIKEISQNLGHKPIYLVAMNKSYSKRLKDALVTYSNINVDHYRSDLSMGYNRQERICIAVGEAHRPVRWCDPLAEGDNDAQRQLDSIQLRLNEVHAATFQSWSAVIDPDGKEESHVYCIGVRAHKVSNIVTWGTNRRVMAYRDSEDKTVTEVLVDEEFPRPKVYMEERTSRGRSRHKISEYIDRVQSIKTLLDHRKSSFDGARSISDETGAEWNSRILVLSNTPHEDVRSSSFAFSILFAGRQDFHARKSKKPGKDEEHRFRKTETTTDIQTLIKAHLERDETIGFYPIDDNDICHYCAVVFSDQKGDESPRNNALKLSNYLVEEGLPVLVEMVHSSDMYRIWISIIPTKTLTVYKFVRQLVHDAGVNSAKVYPQQKSINSCHSSLGDYLVLPMGSSESSDSSEFIDPISFRPTASVSVDKVIRFREIEEVDPTGDTPEDTIEEGD